MGHATHFLSRLERLEPAETELALSLYRDPTLLAGVLSTARLPETAERVAIALRRQPGGPHLVVTREGQFVTCLGPGMSIAGLPLLERGQLDTRAERIERLRECIATANSGKNTRALFDSLMSSGHLLSREDFVTLNGFAPALCTNYLELLTKHTVSVMDDRSVLEAQCARLGAARPGEALRTRLLVYWNRLWSAGHFAALVTDRIREVADLVVEENPDFLSWLTDGSLDTRFLPTAVRGLLLPSRMGKLVLPSCKQRYRASHTVMELIEAGSALAAIAVRHEGTRAEILKLISKSPQRDAEPHAARANEHFLKGFRHQIEHPEAWCACVAKAAIGGWNDWTHELPADSGLRIHGEPTLEQLALCLTASCNVPTSLEEDPAALSSVAALVGTAGPEALYLPRAVLDELRPVRGEEWAVQQAMRLLLDYRRYYPHHPERAAPAPGPNERCPCGSGLKFKRCCQNKVA